MISYCINFYELDFASKFKAGKIMSSILSIALLFLSLVTLPIIWILIKRGISQGSNREEFTKNYRALIAHQRVFSGIVGGYWKLLTLIRWTLTAIILIFLRDYNSFQLITLLIISVIYSCLLIAGKPFKNNLKNKVYIFTECIVSIYLYILMCLTDFMGEISIRELLALGLLAAIGLTILVNFVVMGKIAIQKFKKWRRKR